MGTIGFLIPKNMGIDIKIVTLARAKVMAKYVISMAAILNVWYNEDEGRKKLNPNIFGLFDP